MPKFLIRNFGMFNCWWHGDAACRHYLLAESCHCRWRVVAGLLQAGRHRLWARQERQQSTGQLQSPVRLSQESCRSFPSSTSKPACAWRGRRPQSYWSRAHQRHRAGSGACWVFSPQNKPIFGLPSNFVPLLFSLSSQQKSGAGQLQSTANDGCPQDRDFVRHNRQTGVPPMKINTYWHWSAFWY